MREKRDSKPSHPAGPPHLIQKPSARAEGPTEQASLGRSPTARTALALAAVLLFALGVRVAHLLDTAARDPFYHSPPIDSAYHDTWAKQIIGEEDASAGVISPTQAYFKPPLYPYLLAAVYKVFGVGPAAPRVLQILLGAISCVLIAILGLVLFDRATGIVAGILAALYGPLIYLDGCLLDAGLCVFFSVLAILALLQARRAPRIRWWLVAGIIISLATITRPTILIAGSAFAAWILYGLWREGERRRTMALAGAFALGLALFIAPVTIRNYRAGGELVIVSANAGINFFTGNRKGANGYSAIPVGARWDKYMMTALRAGADKPGAASRFWMGEGLRELAATPPHHILALYLRKVAAFFGEWEIRNNLSYAFVRRYSWVLLPSRLCFGLVGPLALAGLILARRERKDVSALVTFGIGCILAGLPFFVCDRYRAPFVFIFIILAAFAGVSLFRRATERQWRPFGMLLALTIAFGFLVHADLTGARAADNRGRDYVLLGNMLFSNHELPQAKTAYEISLERNDTDPDAHMGLAMIAESTGDLETAAAEYGRALDFEPTFFDAQNNLGAVLVKQGKYDEAHRWLQTAIETAPDSSRAWLNMGICRSRLKRPEEALKAARKASDLDPKNIQAWLLISDLLVADEATLDEAEAAARKAKTLDPDWPGADIALAHVYSARGEANRAVDQLMGVPAPHSRSAEVRINLAVALERASRNEEALEEYRAIALNFRGGPIAAYAASRITALQSP